MKEDELEVLKELYTTALGELRNLREICGDFCCSLNEDSSMNKKVFHHLCTLAMHVGCTHLPWWDNEDVVEEEKEDPPGTCFVCQDYSDSTGHYCLKLDRYISLRNGENVTKPTAKWCPIRVEVKK